MVRHNKQEKNLPDLMILVDDRIKSESEKRNKYLNLTSNMKVTVMLVAIRAV